MVNVTLYLGLIKLCKIKTDFQLWQYTEVRRQTHAPAALLPGKAPERTEQEAGWAPEQLQKIFSHLNFSPTTDVCNNFLNMQCNLLKWKTQRKSQF
jgi:hypothetical protein